MKTALWGVLLSILVGFLLGAGVTYAAVQYSYEVEVPASVVIATCTTGDLNNDDHVNILDMVLIGQHFGQIGSPGWIPEDVKEDGVINVLDMIIIGQHWTGQSVSEVASRIIKESNSSASATITITMYAVADE